MRSAAAAISPGRSNVATTTETWGISMVRPVRPPRSAYATRPSGRAVVAGAVGSVTVVSEGFIYAATGDRWIREAIASATRLKEVHPETPSMLFTDDPDVGAAGPFDEVRRLPDQKWTRSESKLWSIQRTPFDRTVYLDTDTYACRDLSQAFTVLDRFDV